jgi:hypothetical protein
MSSNIYPSSNIYFSSNIYPSSNIYFSSNIYDNNSYDKIKYFIDKIRIIRNELLNATDKFMLSDYPISPEDLEIVKKYRNDLRDYMFSNNLNVMALTINDLPIAPSFLKNTIVPTTLINVFPYIINDIHFEIISNT